MNVLYMTGYKVHLLSVDLRGTCNILYCYSFSCGWNLSLGLWRHSVVDEVIFLNDTLILQ